MSAPQFTPPPWEAVRCHTAISVRASNGSVALVPSRGVNRYADEANARLIAAAPKLYEAGAALIERMFDTLSNGKGVEADDGEKCWIVHSDDIEDLRAALAKARGDA